MRIYGAPWMADLYGGLLSAGAAGAFFYEYEPVPLTQSGSCWGTYGLNLGNAAYRAGAPLSQYAAAQLLTQHWTRPGAGVHTLFPASSASVWIGAYPVHRPDRSWALLLVNRDLKAPHAVTLGFGTSGSFHGNVAGHVFSAFQYDWVKAASASRPSPELPLAAFSASGGLGVRYVLPPRRRSWYSKDPSGPNETLEQLRRTNAAGLRPNVCGKNKRRICVSRRANDLLGQVPHGAACAIGRLQS